MKKFLLFFVMAFAWIGITSAEKGDNPSVYFKVKTYDFGTFKEADGKVSCDFSFTNKGNAPLVIFSATAGCGCTTPEYPKEPIAPGASGTIKVTYNPAGRPGEFTKTITVKTNDPSNKRINLKIKGVVVPKY